MEERDCLEAEDALTIEIALPFLLLLLLLELEIHNDEGEWLKHSDLEADAAYVRDKLLSIPSSSLFFSFFFLRNCGKVMENKIIIPIENKILFGWIKTVSFLLQKEELFFFFLN